MARVKFSRGLRSAINAINTNKTATEGEFYFATDDGTLWYGNSSNTLTQVKDNINTTYGNASTSAAGLMSSSDKSKLDGITASADSVSFTRSATSGNKVGTITINGTGTDLYSPTQTSVSGNAGTATKLSTARTIWGQSFNGSANISGNMTNVGTVNGIIKPISESVTSNTGTSAKVGTRLGLEIYGMTYGNDANYLKSSGEISYGDPGPQIIFNTVADQSNSNAQPLALVYSDNDAIATGVSLSLVTNQSDAYFIAPHIKALSGFIGNLSGNAATATKLANARNLQVALGSTTAVTFDGSGNQTSIPISGTLAVGHGGTGATSLTSGAVLIGNGTSAIATRSITNNTSKTYTTASTNIPTANTIAYWNGAYNSNNASNLTYCSTGTIASTNMIVVSSTQPSASDCKLWIKI